MMVATIPAPARPETRPELLEERFDEPLEPAGASGSLLSSSLLVPVHQVSLTRWAWSVLSMSLPRTGSALVARAWISAAPAPLKKKGTTWLVCASEYYW